MKYIGVLQDLSYKGTLIAKVKYVPPIGSKIVDKRKGIIGTITKVMGPVKAPYISIRPHKAIVKGGKLLSLIGADIFSDRV